MRAIQKLVLCFRHLFWQLYTHASSFKSVYQHPQSVPVCTTRKIEPRAHFVFIICGSQPLMIFDWHFFSVDGLPAEVSEWASERMAHPLGTQSASLLRPKYNQFLSPPQSGRVRGTQKLSTGFGKGGNRRRVPVRQVAYACTPQALTSLQREQVGGEPGFWEWEYKSVGALCSVVILISVTQSNFYNRSNSTIKCGEWKVGYFNVVYII
jgi:hypothetical protein